MTAVRWLAERVEGGHVAFRIGRCGDALVAEWTGLARLVAARDGSSARIEPAPDADARAIAKLERGAVQLLLRQLAGKPAFHGAAVAVRRRAAILLGMSGRGKSTLAAWLCTHADGELFADDAVAVDAVKNGEAWVVTPAESDHWLDASARRAIGVASDVAAVDDEKVAVRAAHPGRGTARLDALVDLVFADVSEPRLTRLAGVDALACIVPQAIRFVLDDPELQKRELDTLVRLVAAVPVFRLERPRSLALLGASAERVLRVLGPPGVP